MSILLLFLCGIVTAQQAVKTYDFPSELIIKNSHTPGSLSMSFVAFNSSYHIELDLHRELVHSNATLEIHSEQGIEYLPIAASNAFKGEVFQEQMSGAMQSVGWARLFITNASSLSPLSIDGTIKTIDDMFHIREISRYSLSKRSIDVAIASPFSRPASQQKSNLIVFKDDPGRYLENAGFHHGASSTLAEPHSCGIEKIDANLLTGSNIMAKRSLFKRVVEGCPTSKMVLPIGIAADCTYIQQHGGTQASLSQILSNVNTASAVYEASFNVQLGVTRVVMAQNCQSDPTQPWNQQCSAGYTISQRLSDFSKWRASQTSDKNGIWQLVSNCPTLPSVGIAWLGQMCQTGLVSQGPAGNQQFVSGTSVATIVPVEWKVTAHEIGHLFGSEHDCIASTCPCADPSTCNCISCSSTCDCKGQFIMHPLDNAATDKFSPGSISRICSQFSNKMACLKGINHKLILEPSEFSGSITAGICGNGIKEGNEECDCGQPSDCRDSCCNAATCKLQPSAKCADGNDSCCKSCQIQSNGTVCYRKTSSCDQDLICDGVSKTCPLTPFLPDGTSCPLANKKGFAQCASGVCTSRDIQCQASGLGITTTSACPAFLFSCQMNCQDNNGNCYQLAGSFLDGTPCGGNGSCKSGSCVGSNPFALAWMWFNSNPQYGYPILIAIIVLILSCLCSCVRRCRRSKSRFVNVPTARNSVSSHLSDRTRSNNQSGSASGRPSGWVDPKLYNGNLSDRDLQTVFIASRNSLSQNSPPQLPPRNTGTENDSSLNSGSPVVSQQVSRNSDSATPQFSSGNSYDRIYYSQPVQQEVYAPSKYYRPAQPLNSSKEGPKNRTRDPRNIVEISQAAYR